MVGVDAQDLRIRLEAYIAQTGPHFSEVEGHERLVEKEGSRVKSRRVSALIEDLPEKRWSTREDLPSGLQTSAQEKSQIPLRDKSLVWPNESFDQLLLPNFEFVDGRDLFSPHLLEQVVEEEEPQDAPGEKPLDRKKESPQSQSPSAILRRVASLENPRRAYKSQQQRSFDLNGTGTGVSYSTDNERKMIEEAFSQCMNLPSFSRNEGTKQASKIIRFSDEKQ